MPCLGDIEYDVKSRTHGPKSTGGFSSYTAKFTQSLVWDGLVIPECWETR